MATVAPPLRNEISDTYPLPSDATARAGFGKLWDYVTNLLGTTGSPETARAALGVPPRATRVDVASVAGTVDLTTSAPHTDDIRITGDLDITKFTVAVGRVFRCTAGGKFTLAHNANIVTPCGQTLSFADKESFWLRAIAADIVEVMGVQSTVVLSPQVAGTAVGSMEFTELYGKAFPGGYDLIIDNILPTTNAVNLLLQYRVAGVWQVSGYAWATSEFTTASGAIIGQSGTGTGVALNSAGLDPMSNAASQGAHFVVHLPNLAAVGNFKRCEWSGNYFSSVQIGINGWGVSPGTGAIDGVRVIPDSGTIQADASTRLVARR